MAKQVNKRKGGTIINLVKWKKNILTNEMKKKTLYN